MSVHSHTVSFKIFLNDIKNKAECITIIYLFILLKHNNRKYHRPSIETKFVYRILLIVGT